MLRMLSYCCAYIVFLDVEVYVDVLKHLVVVFFFGGICDILFFGRRQLLAC
jgi:hypothetical protein